MRNCPRATVPGTGWRSERPSEKKVVGSYGKYFGWMCMSRRQPARSTTIIPRDARLRPRAHVRPDPAGRRPAPMRERNSAFNFVDSVRLQALKKRARLDQIEFLVARLDA